jgi:hypothetical protein
MRLVGETPGGTGVRIINEFDQAAIDDLLGTQSRAEKFNTLIKNSEIDAEELKTLREALTARGGALVRGAAPLADNVDSIQAVNRGKIALSGDTSYSGTRVRATVRDDRLDEPLEVNLVYPENGRKLVGDAVEDNGWKLDNNGVVKNSDKNSQSEIHSSSL